MKRFTVFQLCKESDGYQIFYDYKKEKLYGCYTPEEEIKPNYGIFLIQPFLIIALKIFCDWAVSLEIWGQWLMRLSAVVMATLMIQYFWEKLSEKTQDIRNKRWKELPDATEIEWEHFLSLGGQQIRKEMSYYLLAGLGMAGSAAAFVWTRSLVFLGIYSLLYFLAYPFVLAGRPVRKYKFIKNRRREG